ncbi:MULTISPECIES: putative electron transfer flavoprotein FixA [unclassified Desulfovibrio]|uniref:putative electron transfer flavoprotein FixA n=1 Tax=unclassified Desulfovibrio TaxID=2593640 RepID=UPI0013E9CFC1|nr:MULTISPECIES: putative electron transfer flavoprotein FixA [unclassified Desulfovibrio]
MNIIVCCKVVPEEQDIVVKDDGSIDLSRAAAKISQYDLNAIEAAMNLAGEGGQVTALTAGSPKWLESTKIRKDILSRGPHKLEIIMEPALEGALPDATAALLAPACREIGFDLIICGEGSGDLYAQQTGLLLGEMLDIPAINAVSSIAVENGALVVERELEREQEILEMPLPALVCVSSDINTPKIPTMKAILSAAKKPANVREGGEVKSLSEVVSICAPKAAERKNEIVEGDAEEKVDAFIAMLRKVLQG